MGKGGGPGTLQEGARVAPSLVHKLPTPGVGYIRKEKVPPPLPPIDPKTQKQMRKAEKAEREFRKKFKVQP